MKKMFASLTFVLILFLSLGAMVLGFHLISLFIGMGWELGEAGQVFSVFLGAIAGVIGNIYYFSSDTDY